MIINQHIPVLLPNVVDFLLPNPDSNQEKNVFDGTFGGGGYTEAFLQKDCQVYATDLDFLAIEIGKEKFAQDIANNKLDLQQENFAVEIDKHTDNFFDGIVLDLGFSSNQLEFSNRGFSYQKLEEELDLRYNQDLHIPCWQKLRFIKTQQDISKILYTYSGEQFSGRIAEKIFAKIQATSDHKRGKKSQDKNHPLFVKDIYDAVMQAIPARFHYRPQPILSRVWQALRIWTNGEFQSLEDFLSIAPNKLKTGGRLGIVCFHSLEDKIVTNVFRKISKPKTVDEMGNKTVNFRLLTPKAITASEEELQINVRSRSATLRVLEKI